LDFRLFALLVWSTIPLIFFSFAATKMQGYILFASPAIFIITAWFIVYLLKMRLKLKPWLFYSLFFLILFFPIRYSVERLKIFDPPDTTKQWAEDLKRLNDLDIPKNTVIFNCERPIDAMFYSDFTVYHFLPDANQISRVRAAGYEVGIYENGMVKLVP
jgi:4-amino-4-deoxy-L-arabinose transferase